MVVLLSPLLFLAICGSLNNIRIAILVDKVVIHMHFLLRASPPAAAAHTAHNEGREYQQRGNDDYGDEPPRGLADAIVVGVEDVVVLQGARA